MENANKNYEWVELPSKGQCYPIDSPLRKGKVKMAYLTAMDENIIQSPKAYKDKKLLDIILERKIVDKDIDCHLLCKGDRDAIVLWLRRTGYGNNFPVTVRSLVEDGKVFSTTIDLTQLKYFDFELTGDEDGYFMYFMKNGDIIKFKYLSVEELDEFKLKVTDGNSDNTIITDALKAVTMAVNENKDKDYIGLYVDNMRVEDAFLYRSFMSDNMPRVDMETMVSSPDGKDKITVQLLIDDAIFLNT